MVNPSMDFDFKSHSSKHSEQTTHSQTHQPKANNTSKNVRNIDELPQRLNSSSFNTTSKPTSVFEQITRRKPYNLESINKPSMQPIDDTYETDSMYNAYNCNRGESTSITTGLQYSSQHNNIHSKEVNRRFTRQSAIMKPHRYKSSPRRLSVIENKPEIVNLGSLSRQSSKRDYFYEEPHYNSGEQIDTRRSNSPRIRMERNITPGVNNLWKDSPNIVKRRSNKLKTKAVKRRLSSKIRIRSEPQMKENQKFKKIAGIKPSMVSRFETYGISSFRCLQRKANKESKYMFSKWLKTSIRTSDAMTREICSLCTFRAVVKKQTTKTHKEKEMVNKDEKSKIKSENKKEMSVVESKERKEVPTKTTLKVDKKPTIKKTVSSVHRMRTRSANRTTIQSRNASKSGKRSASNASISRCNNKSVQRFQTAERTRVMMTKRSSSLNNKTISSKQKPIHRPYYRRNATQSPSDVSDVTRRIITKCIDDIRQRSRSRSPVARRASTTFPIRRQELSRLTTRKAQLNVIPKPTNKVKTRSMTAKKAIANIPKCEKIGSNCANVKRSFTKIGRPTNNKAKLSIKSKPQATKSNTRAAKKSNQIPIRRISVQSNRFKSTDKLTPRQTRSSIQPTRRSVTNIITKQHKTASKSQSLRRFDSVKKIVPKRKCNRTVCSSSASRQKTLNKRQLQQQSKSTTEGLRTRAQTRKLETDKCQVIKVDEQAPIHDTLTFSMTGTNEE